MSLDDRLRSAITVRTSRVEPSADALQQIEEKLMEVQRHDKRSRVLISVGAAAAVVAVVVGFVALTGDDDQDLDVAGTTTTLESTTTTEETTTTEQTTTTFAPTVDPATPVWPQVATSQRFDSPEAVAHSFAVDYLGFVDPVMGAFQQGDTRSGEVPVQPTAEGPTSTILVRQLEDDTWFVIGADTADITLDEPAAGADIDCPVHVAGEALAFEGHVDVAVRADAVEEPVGTGFVTGGGGPAAPFQGDIDCDLSQLDDGMHYGAIVLSTASGEDGRIWTAEVIRIQLT
jgi:hypothetical protein